MTASRTIGKLEVFHVQSCKNITLFFCLTCTACTALILLVTVAVGAATQRAGCLSKAPLFMLIGN